LLEIGNLVAGYGEITVLRDVSLRVGKGEFVALLGANNAGKSTLINCLSGVVPTRAGRMVFGGVDFTNWKPYRIVDLGLVQVPEGRQVFPKMSVLENLLMGAMNARVRDKRPERLSYVFDLFPRLAERRQQLAGTLSGGEQQMLVIGRALMAGPELLMLDEPSLGLAPMLVENIFATLRVLNGEGLTILLVEQNMSLSLAYASRGYVLEHGKVAIDGPSEELRKNPETRRAYLGL
jgi:branched-chain amino acid transport system ATP-binding protein